ncbi:hypothetical protein OS493_019370 [Desmophyllum pertusum]|uniref:Uncharacterized protein n=1 Tax=Desmophyllum pertusum TaxID=174260 RepID=A0A9X0A443_9CNID|nr:hypothetical protein OS493_019370 [Desmophyllum pertusum]
MASQSCKAGERKCGGDEDQTEVELLVEELVALEAVTKKAEEQDGAKKEVVAKEKKQAVEIRNRALERVGQTRKRNTEENEGKQETKRRRSGGEALEWLKEKGESMRQLKEQEVQNKKEEREAQRMQHEQFMRQLEATQTSNNEQMKLFQQQMLQLQQQRQQQQQQFAMLQQQMMIMMQSLPKNNFQ